LKEEAGRETAAVKLELDKVCMCTQIFKIKRHNLKKMVLVNS